MEARNNNTNPTPYKKKKVPRKPAVLPIYISGAVWLLLCLRWDLTALSGLLWLPVVTGMTYFITSKIFRGRKMTAAEIKAMKEKKLAKEAARQAKLDAKKKELKAPEPAKKSLTGDPELDALLNEGDLAITELSNLRRACRNRDVEVKILQIENISRKILDNAVNDRRDVPRTRKFLTYYLPTTLKLLHAHDRMSDESVTGENISGTVKRIEDMLDDIIAAYNKQYDAMFSDEAIDIETDIRVLEATIDREGLK